MTEKTFNEAVTKLAEMQTTLLSKVDARAENDQKTNDNLTKIIELLTKEFTGQIQALQIARDNAYGQIKMQAEIIKQQTLTITQQNETINRMQAEISKSTDRCTKAIERLMLIIEKAQTGVTINQ